MQDADKAREKGQVKGMAISKKAVEGASLVLLVRIILTAAIDFSTLLSSLSDPVAE